MVTALVVITVILVTACALLYTIILDLQKEVVWVYRRVLELEGEGDQVHTPKTEARK